MNFKFALFQLFTLFVSIFLYEVKWRIRELHGKISLCTWPRFHLGNPPRRGHSWSYHKHPSGLPHMTTHVVYGYTPSYKFLVPHDYKNGTYLRANDRLKRCIGTIKASLSAQRRVWIFFNLSSRPTPSRNSSPTSSNVHITKQPAWLDFVMRNQFIWAAATQPIHLMTELLCQWFLNFLDIVDVK